MLLGNRVPGLVVRKYIQSALEDKLSTSDFGATPGTPMMAAFIPSASSRDQQALRGKVRENRARPEKKNGFVCCFYPRVWFL
jgi:hypothetical protein